MVFAKPEQTRVRPTPRNRFSKWEFGLEGEGKSDFLIERDTTEGFYHVGECIVDFLMDSKIRVLSRSLLRTRSTWGVRELWRRSDLNFPWERSFSRIAETTFSRCKLSRIGRSDTWTPKIERNGNCVRNPNMNLGIWRYGEFMRLPWYLFDILQSVSS